MKITVIGNGYVGLVTAACLADLGNEVTCVGRDETKITKLKAGKLPIYEPGLDQLVLAAQAAGRLTFTTDLEPALKAATVIFLAVGTPPGKNHEADLSQVRDVASAIGQLITDYKVVVTKSTVPVGTNEMIRQTIEEEQKKRDVTIPFDVASNPEFLREGNAVHDFLHPDRVVVGLEKPDARARRLMEELYAPITDDPHPLMITDIRSAELIKYASNCFLATKISFINELANFAEEVGADIGAVARGVGLDRRIGQHFLQAGIGYGGSCFPKDVQALIQTGKSHNYHFGLLEEVEAINQRQRLRIVEKLDRLMPTVHPEKIGIWGLAFKPNTDDLREAPSLTLIPKLREKYPKATLTVYDPVAAENARSLLPKENIIYADSAREAAKDSDVLVILTEWEEFRLFDLHKLKSLLRQSVVIDGRNIYDPVEMAGLGFSYASIGRGLATPKSTKK